MPAGRRALVWFPCGSRGARPVLADAWESRTIAEGTLVSFDLEITGGGRRAGHGGADLGDPRRPAGPHAGAHRGYVHGYEYPPITGAQQLRTGSIRTHSPAPCSWCTSRTCPRSSAGPSTSRPVDGQNLNRVYPGRPGRDLSERIAHDHHHGDHRARGLSPRSPRRRRQRGAAPLRVHARDRRCGLRRRGARARARLRPRHDRHRPRAGHRAGRLGAHGHDRHLPRHPGHHHRDGLLGGNDAEHVELAVGACAACCAISTCSTASVEPNDGRDWLEDFEVVRSPATGVFRARVAGGLDRRRRAAC